VSERILVIKLGSFADVLLSMGELRAVDDRHPDAEIAVLTRKPYKRIYDRCPWVNEVIVDPTLPRWRPDYLWSLGRELGSDFAYVFDLQRNRRTGFCRRWLAVGKVPWFGERGDTSPAIEAYLRWQNGVDARPPAPLEDPGLSWMAEDSSRLLAGAGVESPYVLLMPGAAARHQRRKCWPHYAELAEALIRRGVSVVTAPEPDDTEACGKVPGATLFNPDGRWLDFFQLAGVQQVAAYCVGNDSGPTHLVALIGAPTLGLIGGGDADRLVRNVERKAATCLRERQVADISVAQVLDRILPLPEHPAA